MSTPITSNFKTSTSGLSKTLYSTNNVTIGITGSIVSSAFDVSPYSVKSIYAYLYPTTQSSGSLVVSGSFDRTNYYQLKSGSFNSGSLSYFTFFDSVPLIKVSLISNNAAAAVSGSLFIVVS
jgi:hypothetical protein